MQQWVGKGDQLNLENWEVKRSVEDHLEVRMTDFTLAVIVGNILARNTVCNACSHVVSAKV